MRSLPSHTVKNLVAQLRELCRNSDLPKKLYANIAKKGETRPWAQETTDEAVALIHRWACPGTTQEKARHITKDKPFRLNLLRAMASKLGDQDVTLFDTLEQGVHTGCIATHPIEPSGVWRAVEDEKSATPSNAIEFDWCQGNWTQAELEPDETLRLVEK